MQVCVGRTRTNVHTLLPLYIQSIVLIINGFNIISKINEMWQKSNETDFLITNF